MAAPRFASSSMAYSEASERNTRYLSLQPRPPPFSKIRRAAYRHRITSASHRQGTAVALLAHDETLARDRDLPRPRARGGGRTPPARRSVLVPGLRVRARLRLALEWRDDHGLWRREGGPAPRRSR